jgi:predicted ester cyclase
MSTEANKALVRRGIEELNQGDVLETSASWDELFVPDFVRHDPAGGFRSREDYKRFLSRLLVALPGHFTIEDLIAEGDKVVLRYTFRGTHQGQWRGIPPTGKAVTFTGSYIYRIVDGKIVEGWENADTLGLLQQLGAVPSMS